MAFLPSPVSGGLPTDRSLLRAFNPGNGVDRIDSMLIWYAAVQLKTNDIFLAGGLDDFPNASKTGADDEAVACGHAPTGAAVFGHDRNAAEDPAIFPIVILNSPFAGRRFPQARVKHAGPLLDITGT